MTPRVWSLTLAGLAAACMESGYVLSESPARAPAEGDESPGGAPPLEPDAAGASNAAGSLPELDCDEPFQVGTSFSACAISYFGSEGSDQLLAAAIGPGGEIFVAGVTARNDLGESSLAVPEATSGVVLRLEGGRLVSSARVGAIVHDLDVTASSVLAATDLGVFALSLALDEVLGQATNDGEATRLAASDEGAAALLANNRALLLNAAASVEASVELGADAVEDLAFDAELGLLFVTGSRAAAAGGACTGTIPFLRALDLTGARRWAAYDFVDAPDWCASSTGRRLALSGGKLFYAGEQHGGNSVHLRDPRDLAAQAALVSYDSYSNGSGKAIEVYSFVARFDAVSGTLEAGQVILPRDGTVGGSLSASALAVDDEGRIFLGGEVSCCLERRDERIVAGQRVGTFLGPEASLVVLSSDLRERLAWTTFTGNASGNPRVSAIAVGDSFAVLTATTDSSRSLLTHQASQASPAGSDEGYFVLFPVP